MRDVRSDERDDEALLVAWKAGDQQAGAALLVRHHVSVARFFMHKLGHDCDDLVQATFLGLLEGFERFRGEASFRSFLFGIARNQLYTRLYERARDRQRFDPSVTSVAALQLTPSEQYVEDDAHRLLLAALRSLPIDVQIMLELHYWEGMRVREIAEVLDINANTVKTRMKRAREQLEREMSRLAASPQQLRGTIERLSEWARQLQGELEAQG